MAKPRKTIEEYFWSRVDKTDHCWLWTGRKDSFGYGVVQLGSMEPRTGAHRVSWALHNGPLPMEEDNKRGVCVLHKCDVPSCVNPDHLFLGDRGDNLKDAIKKGRHKAPDNKLSERSHCPNGHEFDQDNTYIFESIRATGSKKRVRLCRKCRAENQRVYRKRKYG